MNDEYKMKIEEIITNNNDWNADEEETEIFGVEYSSDTMKTVVKELLILFTEMVEGELRGFVDEVLAESADEDREIGIKPKDKVKRWVNIDSLKEQLNQYLLERKK